MFYRRNVGSAQQAMRIAVGVGAALSSLTYLSGARAWVTAGGGLALILTALIGWCPACAVLGANKRSKS